MSKTTLFSVFVFAFLGIPCILVNSQTTQPTLNDWREMVELRLLNLERELKSQKQANTKLQAENREMQEAYRRTKHRKIKLHETLSKSKSVISTQDESRNFSKENLFHPSENQLYVSLKSIEDESTNTVKRKVPTNSKDSEQVAFYSFISVDTTRRLYFHQILIYDTVKLNKGNAYHNHSGIFIVPVSGTYAFVWTLGVSEVGWVSTEITINGQKYGRAYADGDRRSRDFGTGFVIAEVDEGDLVYIRMHPEGDPVLYGNGRTSFSGWKL